MRIEIGPFGERVPIYDSLAEGREAIRQFLDGNYGALTCDEVTFLRDCVEDPLNHRWEREHAGELCHITQSEVDAELFIHRPNGETLEESRAWLKSTIGPHPITPANLYEALHSTTTTIDAAT